MKWNGRSYRPINQIQIKKREFDLEDALRPLGQKMRDTHWVANVLKTESSIPPSQTPTNTPTPSITPSVTPTITSSVTPTITPTTSITPSVTVSPTVTPTTTLTPTPSSSQVFDPDAQAFFNAVEGGGDTLTPTEKSAVNTLVLNLKSDNLWNSLDCFYPFVGGTSSSTKWNLKDPRDLDAAFRITWTGGMSFASSGITGNALNSGGETYLNPQSQSYTGITMGVSINGGLVDTPTGWYDMGGFDGTDDAMISLGFNDKTTKYVCFNNLSYITTTSGTYTASLLTGVNDGIQSLLYQNATVRANVNQSFANINRSIGIGYSNRASPGNYSGRGYSVSFIAKTGYSSGQISNLNTTINTFNTTLSR